MLSKTRPLGFQLPGSLSVRLQARVERALVALVDNILSTKNKELQQYSPEWTYVGIWCSCSRSKKLQRWMEISWNGSSAYTQLITECYGQLFFHLQIPTTLNHLPHIIPHLLDNLAWNVSSTLKSSSCTSPLTEENGTVSHSSHCLDKSAPG